MRREEWAMAKHSTAAGTERSKVRLLFFEGELAPGEIQALASAFATKPNGVASRAPQKQLGGTPTSSGSSEAAAVADFEVEQEVAVEDEVEPTESTPAAKPRRVKRTYPTPATVEMDMNAGGKSFKQFAQEKRPKSHFEKYLVAAAWCSQYAKLPAITPGHVRTCYIAAEWNYKVQDPIQPFRNIRDDGLGSVEGSNFTIGHLGLSKVQEMNSGKDD